MRPLVLLAAAATFLFAAAPDREPKPEEWGYRPADGSTVPTNPPNLSWTNDSPGNTKFTLQLAQNADFRAPLTVPDLPWSVYTHNKPLAAGEWFWRYQAVTAAGISDWSRTRSLTIPANAVVFPQPTMDELRARIPREHPRLFVTPAELPRLRAYAEAGGAPSFRKLLQRADQLLKADPTPEPTEMGSASNPQTAKYWWSNRVQTLKACGEAEVLSFVYLITGDPKYAPAARRWIMHLAAWNPDGPTNWNLNDEAAMPMLYRLARVYDWGFGALTEEDRARVRAALLRRAKDAWKAGQIRQGAGHLNSPYNSHGNRAWHKLGENAIATFGETPESELFLNYAVTKFFNAYPVWSDDDGGWHEGLAYWAGYMDKAAWWMDAAKHALGIDGFKKPFFAHFGDYAMYTAPPGSPNGSFGDLAYRSPSPSWSFVNFFARGASNPYWKWWAGQNHIGEDASEPVLAFLWSSAPQLIAKAPTALPPSKVFNGIGVAILNATLLNSADNVQVRFKSSPMGRQSHGHDPHNSFTLNAYGEALLVNNVYRDLYGSPFHSKWVWTTQAQNALLFNGEGQKPHSPDLGGRIVDAQLQDGCDYVAGDATAAYQGKLTSYQRHIVFLKPDIIVIIDQPQAREAGLFQLMLHAHQPFELNGNQLVTERGNAGVVIDYVTPEKLAYRQWDGYNPEPNKKYLADVKSSGIPNQWHVEAATTTLRTRTAIVTVFRPYRNGQKPTGLPTLTRTGNAVVLKVNDAVFTNTGASFSVQRNNHTWTFRAAN